MQLVVCDVPPFRSSLVEVSCENQSNLHFDPQLLGCWVVMNIINGIAKGGSPYVLPPKSGPWGVNAVGEEHGNMCWMHTNVYFLEKNSWLKLGIIIASSNNRANPAHKNGHVTLGGFEQQHSFKSVGHHMHYYLWIKCSVPDWVATETASSFLQTGSVMYVSYVPQVCRCCTCVWPSPSGLPLTTDHTMAVNRRE